MVMSAHTDPAIWKGYVDHGWLCTAGGTSGAKIPIGPGPASPVENRFELLER
jgi:hypothetical protein